MIETAQAMAVGFCAGIGSQVARLPLMGLEKAVLEPLSRRAFRRGAVRILPHLAALFEHLDPMMPEKIASLSAPELVEWVRRQAEIVTGEAWPDPVELEPFWAAFDLRKCAAKQASVES